MKANQGSNPDHAGTLDLHGAAQGAGNNTVLLHNAAFGETFAGAVACGVIFAESLLPERIV